MFLMDSRLPSAVLVNLSESSIFSIQNLCPMMALRSFPLERVSSLFPNFRIRSKDNIISQKWNSPLRGGVCVCVEGGGGFNTEGQLFSQRESVKDELKFSSSLKKSFTKQENFKLFFFLIFSVSLYHELN